MWALAYLPGLLWFRPKNCYINENAGKKIKGGALVIANHIGFFDPVYMMMSLYYRRQHFVATKELFSNPAKKFLFEKVFLCICVDRDSSGLSTVRAVVNALNEGEVVSMFPEGHINFENKNELNVFKSGAVLMALKSGCPIIPMYIQKRRNIFKRQVTVYGEPIKVSLSDTSMPAMAYIDSVTKTVHEKESELEEYYKRITEKR